MLLWAPRRHGGRRSHLLSALLSHPPDESLGPSCDALLLPLVLGQLVSWWEGLQTPKLLPSCLGSTDTLGEERHLLGETLLFLH